MKGNNKKSDSFEEKLQKKIDKIDKKIIELNEQIKETEQVGNKKNKGNKDNKNNRNKGNSTLKQLSEEYSVSIFGIVMTFLLVFTIVSIFSGSVMSIFGFEYENLITLMLFFVATTVFSAPFEFFLNIAIAVLIEQKVFSKKVGKVIFMLNDVSLTFVIMSLVDKIMFGIKGTSLSFLVISLLMATPFKDDIFKKPTSK